MRLGDSMPVGLQQIWTIILSGGPVMVALLLLATLLYWNAMGLWRFFATLDPARLLADQAGGNASATETVRTIRERLRALHQSQSRYLHVLIAAAPLLGLLGTVMGMLDTFRGLGAPDGEETSRVVADGIKAALITTETGLIIAIVGLVFAHGIRRHFRRQDLRLLDLEITQMRQRLSS